MTTYNTYQEAKIAMPLACIIEDTDSGLFFGMPTREGTTLAGGSRFAEPQYYCMTVEKFLADGHKFVEGDVVSNLDGGVSTVNYSSRVKSNDDYCLEYMNYPEDGDEKRYILRAAALENQMNIDNLATQTPEEKEALDLIDTTPQQYESIASKEVEWVNGDELDWLTPDNKWCMCEHLFIGESSGGSPVIEHKATGNMFETYWSVIRKPETPQQREEREREELADTACENMFGESIQNCRPDVAATVRCMIDAGYRKESN